jgi:hypothetical protein
MKSSTAASPEAPILSIVVPTRNRQRTLRVVVDYLLSWDSADFELVIEDNSDDNSGFAEVQARHADDLRLRYVHYAGPRSMVQNCEAAVARARGRILTLIGDDDVVVPQSIEAAHWMERERIDALVCGVAGYTWPDMDHAIAINRGYNGKLACPNARGATTRVDVPEELDSVARSGAQRLGNLPKLYQGFVRKSVIDGMISAVGSCFPGPVPDMANAVAMSVHIRTAVSIDIPLVISGQSRSSMSGRNSVRQHQGKIGSERSLPADAETLWDPRVPQYWSAPTIWAEAAIKAARAAGLERFVAMFSFERVYAACLAYNQRAFYPLVWSSMARSGPLALATSIPVVAALVVSITLKRAATLARKVIFGFPKEEFGDVALAADHIARKIDDEGLMIILRRGGVDA